MDNEKIKEIIDNVENKSNKDLFEVREILEKEFESTKTLIIDLTRHMDTIESLHGKIMKEINKRTVK